MIESRLTVAWGGEWKNKCITKELEKIVGGDVNVCLDDCDRFASTSLCQNWSHFALYILALYYGLTIFQ